VQTRYCYNKGYSINDILIPEPPLQGDLPLILANWRQYWFVFTVDIVKMFVLIRVDPADQDLQRIVWAPLSNLSPIEVSFKNSNLRYIVCSLSSHVHTSVTKRGN
jgi:hypothetical protein